MPALALAPPVGPLVAARTYLLIELAVLREHRKPRPYPLPIGVTTPVGTPKSYALLSRPGSSERSRYTTDYLIRVRVFNVDAVDCENNADLLWALMLAATHRQVNTPLGKVWVSAASGGEHDGDNGPSEFTDPDVALFGYQFAVFWTIAGKPLTEREKH